MKEVVIGRATENGAEMPIDRRPLALAFLIAFERSQTKCVSTYTTEVLADSIRYVVITSSKDIHLQLGRMGRDAQGALIELIMSETTIGNELMVVHARDGSHKGLMCTVTKMHDNLVTITMSIASS